MCIREIENMEWKNRINNLVNKLIAFLILFLIIYLIIFTQSMLLEIKNQNREIDIVKSKIDALTNKLIKNEVELRYVQDKLLGGYKE